MQEHALIILSVLFVLILVLYGLRYYLYRRQRRAQAHLMTFIGSSLGEVQNQLQHQREEMYILENLLAERGLIENADLVEGRQRMIDSPRRRMSERDNLLANHEIDPAQLIVADDENEFQ